MQKEVKEFYSKFYHYNLTVMKRTGYSNCYPLCFLR